MSTENKTVQNEELTKSIDTLLDEVFSETVSKGSPLDLAQDSSTTADAAVSKAPSMQKDDSRGAGRPKQIADVPQTDTDGRRASDYDSAIADASKDQENEEAKKQSKAIDQVSSQGHMSSKPSAPQSAPFKKSIEMTDEEAREFEAFRKSKAESEELKKAQFVRKEQEELIKSAVSQATAKLAKENEELRKSFADTNALIKAMASQPVRAKSITGIEALEKSTSPEEKGAEVFGRTEILDAAFDLAKSGKIPTDAVAEIEMTGRCSDADVRSKIEKQLQGK